jgi:phasin family protein
MMKIEDYQNYTKDGYSAVMAASAAWTKGYQAIAQEVADYTRKSFEKSSEVAGKAMTAKSVEQALEVQQGFAREQYDAVMGEMKKINDIYVSTAKEAYKPFESSLAAFGVKAPATTPSK